MKIVSISIDLPISNFVLAINKEIANLDEGTGSVYHDKGLRLISPNGDQLFVEKTEENEKQMWPIIYQSMKLLISGEYKSNLMEIPFKTPIEDSTGKRIILERIEELKLRNQAREQEQKAIENKNQELGEDDEGHNRRVARSEGLIKDMELRRLEIDRLSKFSHILTPIVIVEGTK